MLNLEKEIRQQPEVLKGIKSANIATLEKLIDDIKHNEITNVCFAARGTSDHASIYAQYLIGILVGLPCALATPSVISKYNGKLNFKNSLVIGVSQSGKAEDVLSVLKRANENGTITVAITNNQDSPMAKEAKYHLFCNAGLESSIAATKTFTSQMYVLALLCGMWAENDDLLNLLDKVPDAVEELLNYMPEDIEKIIERYRYLTSAIVLARGMTYPIALEGALKILETNRVKMKGYPISDFYHGPLAQVSENDLMIVLAAEGPMFEDGIAMIKRLNEINAEVIVISDNAELIKNCKHGLKIPSLGSDFVSPYLFAITLQLIALKLTIVKGIDPDESKVLNKITITK